MRINFPRSIDLIPLMLLSCMVLSGCSTSADSGAEDQNTAAHWALLDPGAVTNRSTSLELGVIRVGCAGGETGNVSGSRVDYQSEKVIVTVSVEPQSDGPQNCPENETVPFQLVLEQPLGERELIDGTCIGQKQENTVMCSDHGVRWKPSMN